MLVKYRGIIFDFNGVLLWDVSWHRQAWERLARSLGRTPFSDAEWKAAEGVPTGELLPRLAGRELAQDELAADEKQKDDLYREVAAEHAGGMRLSPGAEALLASLAARNIPHAIATSSNPRDMQLFVEQLQLRRWFAPEHIVCNDGSFPGKPAPDIYLRAAGAVGVAIGECAVVEDALAGIAGAAAAGAGMVIGLGPAQRHSELRRVGAMRTIETLGEISSEEFA